MDPSAPIVAWGLGTGRHLRRALGTGRPVVVLAIDLDPAASANAADHLGEGPIAHAQRDGRLEVVVGSPATLATRFQAFDPTQVRDMLVNLASLAIAPQPAQPLARLIERIHVESRTSPRTLRMMRSNLRSNLDAIAAAHDLSVLQGRGGGRPGFVIAAGPSAQASVPHLRALRERGPIIAVDTALPLCQRAGVEVDVLCSVDPHRGSAIHLERGTTGVHALAFQPYCTPAIVENLGAGAHTIVALPRGDRFAESIAEPMGLTLVDAAGTVLLYALQAAAVLDCDPVVLVGADFGHVGGFTHAPGTATAKATGRPTHFTTNTAGASVPTTRALLRFQADIERHIADQSRRHWFVDGGGAAIRGAHPTDLPAVLRATARPATGAYTGIAPVPPAPSGLAARRSRQLLAALNEFDSA